MENPFQSNDKVLTKFKGAEVEAVVIQTWKNEVQVKTPDNVLRWRTAKTVWYPPKEQQPEPTAAEVVTQPQPESVAQNTESSAEPQPEAQQHTAQPPAPAPVADPEPANVDVIANADTPAAEPVVSVPAEPETATEPESATVAQPAPKKSKKAKQKALLPNAHRKHITSCGAPEDELARRSGKHSRRR